jgi:Sec7-like guanine-nucleotide exchange factor
MLVPDDPGSSPEHPFRLANHVRRLLRSGESLNRSVGFLFTLAARPDHNTERIVSSAFEIVTQINKAHFVTIVRHGAFADLTVCITHFCKASKFQKISLLAIAMLRGVIPVMLNTLECSLTLPDGDVESNEVGDSTYKYWFPVLFGFYDIIMNGEDLEVRRLYAALSPCWEYWR